MLYYLAYLSLRCRRTVWHLVYCTTLFCFWLQRFVGKPESLCRLETGGRRTGCRSAAVSAPQKMVSKKQRSRARSGRLQWRVRRPGRRRWRATRMYRPHWHRTTPARPAFSRDHTQHTITQCTTSLGLESRTPGITFLITSLPHNGRSYDTCTTSLEHNERSYNTLHNGLVHAARLAQRTFW